MKSIPEFSTRSLGKTGIQVTPIGLVLMELAGSGFFPDIPPSEKNAIILAVLDGGINWFDTVEIFGWLPH